MGATTGYYNNDAVYASSFQALAHYSKQLVVVLSAHNDYSIIYLNPVAEKLYQIKLEEVAGKNYDCLFNKDSLPIDFSLISLENPNIKLNGKIFVSDGVIFNISWSVTAIFNARQELMQYLIVGEDNSIDAKKIKFLENLIANMPGNIYWKNNIGVYLGCNTNTVHAMGLQSESEFIGKSIHDILEKRIADKIAQVDSEVITTGKPIVIEEEGPRVEGGLGTYLTHKVPVFDEQNKVIGLLGVSFDITERKQIENELKEAKLLAEKLKKHAQIYLQTIITRIPGSIYWKDVNGIYLGCNDYVAKMAGVNSPSDMIGKTDYDFSWRSEADTLSQVDKDIMSSGIPRNLEEPLTLADGTDVIMMTNKVPLYDEDGNVVGVLGVSLDITDRKRMEVELREAKDRAEAANKAKSEFLAAVSHELRIPLTGILGMARILSDEQMPEHHAKQVHDIIMSGEHLLALVNDLLDLAKLEAGKLELHPSPLDLRKLIEEIATMLSFQAKSKNLDLLVNYAIDSPQMIIGDARAIRQILLNLMGNAVKFTERGYVKIRVECVSREQLKAHLLITVEDTGIGIPPEKLNSVFERFNQVDSSRTRRYGGAGLGLTITKAYVELMSGRIWVESEVGKGSRFISQIPFPLQDMVNRPSVWDPYRSQLRVLVIDDTLRGDVIAKQLACAHCQVSPGPHAFNTILAAHQKGEPYHIVIMDQQLQSLDAMELGRRINQHRNLQKPMLVLLMPPSTVETRNLAKEQGFFETLIKPVQPSELLVGITAAWERWEDINRAKNKSLSIFSMKQPNILLVEDDPIIQKVHTMMLEKVGCKVAVAQNSQEALAKYANGFDAIFMDVGLPGMSGIEIAAEIRRREAGKGRIPIIGVTGYGYEEDKRNCLEAGMDDVAIKPLKPEELTQFLIKWVAKDHATI